MSSNLSEIGHQVVHNTNWMTGEAIAKKEYHL
jgi:hypothetical protein